MTGQTQEHSQSTVRAAVVKRNQVDRMNAENLREGADLVTVNIIRS